MSATELNDRFVGTATTDYSVYLSIQPGMVSDHTPLNNLFIIGIGSPRLSSVARRRAEN
jgi:hypothetical protein